VPGLPLCLLTSSYFRVRDVLNRVDGMWHEDSILSAGLWWTRSSRSVCFDTTRQSTFYFHFLARRSLELQARSKSSRTFFHLSARTWLAEMT
jgi:hypothetical protein